MVPEPRSNLTKRLEKLIYQYPNCSWLKELLDMDLKNRAKPLVPVTIDNSYTDITYTVYLSDN